MDLRTDDTVAKRHLWPTSTARYNSKLLMSLHTTHLIIPGGMTLQILDVAVRGVEGGWVGIQNWMYCFYGERLNKICGIDCTLH
jgi:hypothetical protein